MRRAIVVAGMHRSGTSAVTRALAFLGADLPATPMPEQPDNEPGFWESQPIADLHQEILASVASPWHDVSAFPAGWFESAQARKYRQRMTEALAGEYGESELFVVKDPRICRLVPFWLDALREIGAEPAFVIPVRNPLEVAASLNARDGLSSSHGLLLWLRHLLDVERDTRGHARVFVSYRELLRDWEKVMRAISERLVIPWARSHSVIRAEVARFLSDEHRHYAFSTEELDARPEIVPWVKRAYAALEVACDGEKPPDAGALDEIRDEHSEAEAAYGPLLAESNLRVREQATAAEALRSELSVKEHEGERMASELDSLQGRVQAEKERGSRCDVQEERLGELRSQLASQQRSIEESENEARRSTELAEVARQRLAVAENRLSEQEAQATRLTSQLASRDQRVDAQERRLEQLASQLVDQQKALSDRLQEAKRLRSRTERLEAEQRARGLWRRRRMRQRSQTQRRRRPNPWLDLPPSGSLRGRLARVRRSSPMLAGWVLRGRVNRLRTFFALRRAGVFQPRDYLRRYPDVKTAGLNPLMHYVEHGAKEGRDPTRWFRTRKYLREHRELLATGENPLLHFVRSGGTPPSPRPRRPTRRSASVVARPTWERLVTAAVPSDRAVAVAGIDDPEPQAFSERRIVPFPQSGSGGPDGREPSSSTAAVANLEALRARGVSHLALPAETRRWTSRHPGFGRHLTRRYPEPAGEESCPIYSLEHPSAPRERPATARIDELLAEHRARFGGEPAVLDWASGLALGAAPIYGTAFEPVSNGDRLPYLDGSVEVVVASADRGPAAIAEARRVARDLVVTVGRAGARLELEAEWRRERTRRKRSASVIIPTHDGAEVLDDCLRTILETRPPDLELEVIVIDDASTDGTSNVAATWRERGLPVRIARNEANLGFLDSCNRGAAEASGEILVFLNNDTIVLPGWLPPLVQTLVDRPDAGAVGGKLVYPDGRLQEAGGVVFSTGGGANFGRNDPDPDAPLYQFLREVDYCSGALLATGRETFGRLGGFDERFRPCYYEDTDYCFRVRDAGARVYYHPASAIVHVEGHTAGTDTSTGPKRHQDVNRQRFVERWSESLKCQPDPPGRWDAETRHRLAHWYHASDVALA